MNILILGSGGREHAFAWKIRQSPLCGNLFIAPGNAGTGSLGENVALDPNDFPGVGAFVVAKNIELVVVGPEVPLALGIRDYFESQNELRNIPLVGPGKQGALLESSKDYAKQFMIKHGVPTAGYATFDQTEFEQGLAYIRDQNTPIVLKADGLAAGKGVVICETHSHAEEVFEEMLVQSKFGEASAKVVVEEFLDGVEISVFVITDGKSYKILPSAKDYKRIGENDTGLNTGGMGAVSPVPFADSNFMKKVEDKIVIPTIDGLQAEGIDFRGFIFLGLINVNDEPMVIEYNVRMGDPETQAVLPRVSSDLVELLMGCATGNLDQQEVKIDDRSACTVVMVSGGYPGAYEKGKVIEGLGTETNSLVFHAGTTEHQGRVVTNGGRVLAITSFGSGINESLQSTYNTVKTINWQDAYYRKDIGQDLLNWLNNTIETSAE